MNTSSATLASLFHEQKASIQDNQQKVRLWRAISWIKRAEQEQEDPDARFVFLWMAFNALYALEQEEIYDRQMFIQFLKQITQHDQASQLHNLLLLNGTAVQKLVRNQYIHHQFWESVRFPDKNIDWETNLHKSADRLKYAMLNKETATVLQILFDRLYVLRNQLVHGGATHHSQLNREPIEQGAKLLEVVVPLMTKILLQNPSISLGRVLFPVIDIQK